MQIWEGAREAAKNNENLRAAHLYRNLFSLKPNVEEALREYVLILMDLEQWQEARSTLQKLLEFDSGSLEYQVYGGRIALNQKHYQLASTYFGQVYTSSPSGAWALEALKGQIAALQKLDRIDLAYPLMEQLYLQLPHDEGLLRNLAQYSLLQKNPEKAISYYRILLTEFEGIDLDFLQSEPLFVAAGEEDMAVHCWKSYIENHPYYIPYHKKLSEFYLAGEEKKKALPHLLVRVAHGEKKPEIFLQIGKLYLYQEGRPDKALYYYDEYQKRNPNDSSIESEVRQIQAILANDLLVIVENEGAWPLWRDLAKVIPDRLAVYYSIAEQLESLGKEKELLEVLEIIHHHNPGDQKVLFQLAQLYFNNKNLSACDKSLNSLSPENQTGKDYFYLRAVVAEKKGYQSKALEYYKSYLQENPSDFSVILYCMKLSGELSSPENINYFYALIPNQDDDISMFHQGSLLYGKLLELNYLPSTARSLYQQLLTRGQLSPKDTLTVERAIVRTLQSENNYFAAEKQLRRLLIKEGGDRKIVEELIHNGLLEKNWQSAWKWYEFLTMDNSQDSLDLFNWKILILEKSGQAAVASEMIEDLMIQGNSPCSDSEQQCRALKIKLAELYYANEEYRDAISLLDSIPPEPSDTLQLQIIRQLVQAGLPATSNSDLPQASEEEYTTAIDKALFYQRYGDYTSALRHIGSYLKIRPGSIKALVLQVELLINVGDDFTALSLLKRLVQDYPQELSFHQRVLELQFKTAKFDDLLQNLAPEWKPPVPGGDILAQRKVPATVLSLSTTNKLLLARTLWALRRWDDSLLLYKSILQPPVDHEFSEQLKSAEVNLILPPAKKTFWNTITFTTPAEPDRLSVVMSPEFTRENLTEPSVLIATGLYTSYRWQQIVSRELSVRQSMNDGNYYQAMKEYQELIKRDPSIESLFDLAGVYSRLGFSGKEAAIYEIIKKESPGYPELDEAIQRNSLKRRPRASILYGDSKKTGREGYYDNDQNEGGLQSWFMPSLTHTVLLDYRRIFNQSDKVEDEELWRNRLEAEIKWSPLYDFDFLMGMGGDRGDDDYGSTFLYNLQVTGRIGDMAQGYFGLAQDVVDDTVEALMDGISKKEYEAGLNLDFLPRLFGGGAYRFTEYSDGNHQNRYELWTSYILHSEPKLLQLRYGYEYSHNANGNKGRNALTTSMFGMEDHPYWSPKEYWQHLFTVSFEHQLAEDVLGRSAPSYYSLEYSFGYETGGYDNHQFNAQIFLEMSRHFLLNSSLDYVHGSEYEEHDFSISLIYRW